MVGLSVVVVGCIVLGFTIVVACNVDDGRPVVVMVFVVGSDVIE